MSYKDNVKPWFETGDYPTQNQFYQWLEWIRWKDEALEIEDINNLTDILNTLAAPIEDFITLGGDFVYDIPAGFLLEKILLQPSSDCKPYATIEAVGGGIEDLVPQDAETTVTDLSGEVWVVNIFSVASRRITIYDLPAGSKVFIIRRKIM